MAVLKVLQQLKQTRNSVRSRLTGDMLMSFYPIRKKSLGFLNFVASAYHFFFWLFILGISRIFFIIQNSMFVSRNFNYMEQPHCSWNTILNYDQDLEWKCYWLAISTQAKQLREHYMSKCNTEVAEAQQALQPVQQSIRELQRKVRVTQ